jgi:thymidylate synthase (FAD)
MTERIELLDHGYVQGIEGWGSDQSIIEAARMSTDGAFRGWSEDAKLLAYLYNNKHSTPFEMAGLIVQVKAPIFIFREWHRHRTQSYNEMSARYIPLPDENYMPTVDRLLAGANTATTNKQAQGSGVELTGPQAMQWLAALEQVYIHAQQVYQLGLNIGIPKELARLPVPVARYSKMRASAVLRNWLAFLTLRKAPNAQWEIRQYADAVGTLIAERFPRTWELFEAEGSYKPKP